MIIYFLTGVGGFILFMFFEIFTLKGIKKPFILIPSFILFLYGSFMVFLNTEREFIIPLFFRALLYMVLFSSLALLTYSLFINIPFKKTYIENGFEQELVKTGLYSISRHPGFLFLSSLLISLSLLKGSYISLCYSLIIIFLDLILIYYQDKVIFPKIFKGYNEYKREVNFILGRRRKK